MLSMKMIKANVIRKFHALKARMQREKPVLFEHESREIVIVSCRKAVKSHVSFRAYDTGRANPPTFEKAI
jgi:hypothetical protein